ncbi:MAG: presenilin enhancer 2 [Monoraphidium minutum]|nr:MAG: presenilin enhancer 2 [Monoraphidium minutum]
MDDLAVESVDGELFEVAEARAQARRYWLAGFALLPLFWAANAWLHWPTLRGRGGGDPVVRKYARDSAAAFAVSAALFLPWALAYTVGGAALLGPRLFHALDATRLDLWGAMTAGG